jgi:hypothetical protein
VSYEFDLNGDLIQSWKDINHLEWTYDSSQIRKLNKKVIFKIDKTGRIVQGTDSTSNEYVIFDYDNNERLRSKDVYSIDPNQHLRTWRYTYEDNSPKLRTIEVLAGPVSFFTHYYSHGLLDSTVYHQDEHTVRYKYVYYIRK